MKTLSRIIRTSIPFLFILAMTNVNGQLLKKLGKRAENAAERAVERRVEKETTEKTDQVLDSILEPGKKEETKRPGPEKEIPNEPETKSSKQGGVQGSPSTSPDSEKPENKSIAIYSKFDFVPGDRPLFFDDFSNDFIGDFPSKWNTNGTGEVVNVGDSANKWFEMKGGYNLKYIPDVPKLPEEYTIE
ncbi:MAG: OmpA family protein, partial [Flavobacteriaceae bacterium]